MTNLPEAQTSKKRLERLEAQLMRQLFWLASLYAAPALLVAAIIPLLDTTAWIFYLKFDWSKFKGGGVIFSLAGFIALGATLVNASFAYANNSQNPNIAAHIRTAAKSLYASLITLLSMMAVTFALNVYTQLFGNQNEDPAGFDLMDIVMGAGLLLIGACTVLAALKFQRFVRNVMQVMRLEADDS